MKTLLLVRHAKSAWDTPGLSDFERPLNERGKRDAPVMAGRVKERIPTIDAFISSTARRARKTAKVFAAAYGVDKEGLRLVDALYLAPPDTFIQVIAGLSNELHTVALFAHNPGITELASYLTEVRIDNMPTCSVFALRAHTDDWSQFEAVNKEFLFFDYPKRVDQSS